MLKFQESTILNFQVSILKNQDIKLNFQDDILNILDTKSKQIFKLIKRAVMIVSYIFQVIKLNFQVNYLEFSK